MITITESKSRFDHLEYYLSEHEYNLKQAKIESKKYRCEILGQEILTFMYFQEMMMLDDFNEGKKYLEKIKEIIRVCLLELNTAIN